MKQQNNSIMEVEMQSATNFGGDSSNQLDTQPNESNGSLNSFFHRDEQKKDSRKIKSSTLSTMCKILKAAIGTGVLAMPQGFSQTYTSGAFFILLVGLLLQYYSWLVLVKAMEERTRQVAEKKVKKRQKNKELESDEDDGYELDEEEEQKQKQEEEEIRKKTLSKQPEPTKPGPSTGVITLQMIKEKIFQEELKKKKEKEELKKEKKRQIEEQRRFQTVQLKQNYKNFSIYDLIRTEFKDNKYILLFLQITTLFTIYGSDVSYVIFLKQTLYSFSPIFNYFWMHSIESLVLIGIILLFSFYKRLESLRWFTIIGSYLSLTILYFVVSLCLFQAKLNVDSDVSQEPNFQEEYPDEIVFKQGVNWKRVPQFFGIALFAYDINAVITVIRQEMEFPYKFSKVLFYSMVIEFCIYGFIGSIGYLAYGQYTADIITINVGVTISDIGYGLSIFYGIIQILYAVSLLISVLLFNVVAFKIITEIVYGISLNHTSHKHVSIPQKLLIRIPFISFTVLTAMFFNQFTIFISLVGSITTVILGFILPYALYIKFLRGKSNCKEFFLNTVVLIFGIIGGILGIVFTFIQ